MKQVAEVDKHVWLIFFISCLYKSAFKYISTFQSGEPTKAEKQQASTSTTPAATTHVLPFQNMWRHFRNDILLKRLINNFVHIKHVLSKVHWLMLKIITSDCGGICNEQKYRFLRSDIFLLEWAGSEELLRLVKLHFFASLFFSWHSQQLWRMGSLSTPFMLYF